MQDESVIPVPLKPAFSTLRLDDLHAAKFKDFRNALQDDELPARPPEPSIAISLLDAFEVAPKLDLCGRKK